MAIFMLMQIIQIVTLPLICISHAEYFSSLNNTEFLQGVIAISPKTTYVYEVTQPSEHVVQNIGEATLTVKMNQSERSDFLEPRQKLVLNFTSGSINNGSTEFIISNEDQSIRAIVYISNFNKDLQEPEKDYDKINFLQQAFSLGVRNIPEEGKTLDTLISYFWPADKDNVWKQIFDVIKVLLNDGEQLMVSQWIESDVKFVKAELDMLNNKTKDNTDLTDDIKKILDTKNIVDQRLLLNNPMLHFYVLPLFSNFITLKMYLIELGTENPKTFKFDIRILGDFAGNILYDKVDGVIYYVSLMEGVAMSKIYNTVYAPGLYNIMMNARTHLALHGLDSIFIWKLMFCKILGKLYETIYYSDSYQGVSYSNYYGRATPDLLEQAIHIHDSPLNVRPNRYSFRPEVAELNYISFNITEGIVCGLKLYFEPKFTSTMGTFETANESVSTLDLSKRKILQLKVYKTKFIRCLELTLSDKNTSMYGDCQDNFEEYEKFELKDHYINSLYLANDYTATDTYFDNVAVSYLQIRSHSILNYK